MSSNEAVDDASSAVDVSAFIYDGVLYLGVANDCAVEACVWDDAGVGTYVAVVAYFWRVL